MREKRVGNAKQRKENSSKAVKSGTKAWKQAPVKGEDERKAGDFQICRAKAETAGKAICSVVSGMVVELYLDHCFSFPRGLEWIPALVMLGICLSILAAALLEETENFWIKAGHMLRAYRLAREAEAISLQLQLENGCSFQENACILMGESREISAEADCVEKVRRKVVAFSRTKRGLRDVS